jgi:hypothetical protein
MDAQTWGVFLVVLGLVQVVLAGFFLRREKPEKQSSSRETTPGKGSESIFWVWIGRLGAVCSMAGVLIILMKS